MNLRRRECGDQVLQETERAGPAADEAAEHARPAATSVPKATKGIMCMALKLASTPIGQANVASGHE